MMLQQPQSYEVFIIVTCCLMLMTPTLLEWILCYGSAKISTFHTNMLLHVDLRQPPEGSMWPLSQKLRVCYQNAVCTAVCFGLFCKDTHQLGLSFHIEHTVYEFQTWIMFRQWVFQIRMSEQFYLSVCTGVAGGRSSRPVLLSLLGAAAPDDTGGKEDLTRLWSRNYSRLQIPTWTPADLISRPLSQFNAPLCIMQHWYISYLCFLKEPNETTD